ncbi:hypothetical protein LJR009_005017 [Bosea sp. LjRoot9]|uniref:hypothetical protein n=1 Tax=Bosea sp. LjRoot9 TaxID=3342341 RepID=UPI003ECFB18E
MALKYPNVSTCLAKQLRSWLVSCRSGIQHYDYQVFNVIVEMRCIESVLMIWLALIYGTGGAWFGLNSIMELPMRRVTWSDTITIAFVSAGWPLILATLGAFALFHRTPKQVRTISRTISVVDQRNRQF